MKRSIAPFGLLALILTLCSAFATPRPSFAALPAHPNRLPFTAFVSANSEPGVLQVNVRATPSVTGTLVAKQPIGTPVTIYAVVTGDAVQRNNPFWYRISTPKSPARFIYSQYVASTNSLQPDSSSSVVPNKGKFILISLSRQSLVAYEDGRVVLDTPVTTGRPELPTPNGHFKVLKKYQGYQFISPWGTDSPFYYPPTWVNYAIEFRTDGYFMHDAPWRTAYGPGTNVPHNDPGAPTGSHGCVNLPLPAEKALYDFVSVGTSVVIE